MHHHQITQTAIFQPNQTILKNHCHRGFQHFWGSKKLFWVNITSKMNSAPSNYSSANFQQNLTTLKKIIKNLMCSFEDIGAKGHFSAKKGGFGSNPPWGANENFFQKSAWNIFLVSPRYNFGQSFRKIWCADLQISRRERTHGRTDERESIGPSANAERPKIELSRL